MSLNLVFAAKKNVTLCMSVLATKSSSKTQGLCIKKTRVKKVATIPVSYIAVSLGEVWLLQASELGSSPPAADSGSHCRL